LQRGKTAVVVGAQWGDEGKGKIVDVLSERFSVVARYAGGHNAGHTVIINGKRFVLQLVPCGVLREGCRAVIGNGVVLDPMAFLKEVAALREAGVQVDGNLFVSNRAHVILPYHRVIELASENAPGRVKIGTTSRGIGPTYEDKAGRRGLRVVDLCDLDLLKKHIENACREKNMIAHALFNSEPLDPTSGGAVIGTGVAPTAINNVIGVTKAYCTRVGEGPFPTELFDAVGDGIRKRGNEFGAVTGRPRRCGWVDLPLLRYSGMINGTSWLVITKLDVLDELKEIPVCVGYKIDGRAIDEIPAEASDWDRIECVYRTLPGWNTTTKGTTEYSNLPKAARDYLEFIARETRARIAMVSTGPGREETIFVDDFLAELQSMEDGKSRAQARR
jgi:adenylosuccinate synthase